MTAPIAAASTAMTTNLTKGATLRRVAAATVAITVTVNAV